MKVVQGIRTALFAGFLAVIGGSPAAADDLSDAMTLMRQGNFKEAYAGFEKVCLSEETNGTQVNQALPQATQCLARLGRVSEIDTLLEGTVSAHAKDWRSHAAVAQQYMQINQFGYLIGGKYQRGHHRGGGKMINSRERDRVRALQLMQQAAPLAMEDDNKGDVASFFYQLANLLLANRGYSEAWRLQYLTELATLPGYDDGYNSHRPANGAPVDAEGKPVYHQTVRRWEDAQTDGQRWRWALDQVAEIDPSRNDEVRYQFAQFLYSQFGVQTMNQNQWGRPMFGMPDRDDGKEDESGTYALHTLTDTETIARLASGIKRFELPDEYNFVKVFHAIAEGDSRHAQDSLAQLAQILANRRQYPKAAHYWQENIRRFGDPNGHKKRNLDQIVQAWGRFEPTVTQSAGEAAKIDFRFRNGKQVKLTAHKIDVDKLLTDVKDYLKSNPGRVDYQRVNIGNIGHRLVHQNETEYLSDKPVSWDVELKPRENHFDRRVTIDTPLRDPGAYLLTAQMQDGNVSKVIVWLSDTALVRKQLSERNLYYVGDAADGSPIEGANVEFFGWRQQRLGNNQLKIETQNFAEITNAEGMVLPDPRDLQREYQWLIVARNGEGRLAYMGFQGVWAGRYYDQEYNQVKVYTITDRPVYRPAQQVNFKLWVRRAQYDRDQESQFAGRSFTVEVFNPKNEKVYSENLTADEYGGLADSFELPADATLGVYRIQHPNGGGTFRVEEYKKPEFEVTVDAPSDPVMLGELIQTTVKAKYYFGSPVTNATVKFKVTRSEHEDNWYPVAPWDWCYGPGYWWFCYDCAWFPGFNDWVGCMRPWPWWYPTRRNPPEVVAEGEAEIGPDGTFGIDIDTSLAKELHGDLNHKYEITAEVRDESRRTIVGTGQVLVARKPFKVYTWLNQGYYQVGQTIRANFKAQTLDRKPVQGEGQVTLYQITYDPQRKPIEKRVGSWPASTNAEGEGQIQLRAARNGQYRLSYVLQDAKEHKVEGGYVFTITGKGFDGSDYRFNHIELIPDKREYAPGEKVKLQINVDRAGGTVLLFVRPSNGVYLPPQVIRMSGKSTIEELPVVTRDMPNFFVEAMTIADGKLHTDAKEIVVPPQKRVLNVAVSTSSKEYKPGEKATVDFQLTDHTGENFVGSAVVAIYDKSLEYISGGSNVGDIREFFWKWQRHHQPNSQSNLGRFSGNMTLPRQPGMQDLGIFGGSVADDLDALRSNEEGELRGEVAKSMAPGGGGFGGGAPRMAMRGMAADGAVAEGMAMAAAPAPMADALQASAGEAPALVEPTVRTNFADTALWVGSITTDKTGRASVSLNMPENLTAWKVKVWAMGHGTKVGAGEAEVVTRKNLLVRLQAPRFFVQKDEVVLSANVHNYLQSDKEVTVALELPGDQLKPLDELSRTVMIPADGEKRIDWRVQVAQEGTATVRMKALTDEESDAVEMSFPCYVHGMLKTEAWAGTVRPDRDRALVQVRVPEERRPEQSLLEVRYSPSLAAAMVDALPYLADYPYGCTEQTLNRFLPTVITQKVLREMEVDLAAVEQKRTNLNAQEIGDDQERAKQWKRFDRNPVFDEAELNRMVLEGLKLLGNMQVQDGGWGWFSGFHERSYPHTTAVVVHGLQIARDNGVPVVPDMLNRGLGWLENYQDGQVALIIAEKKTASNLDAFVYMILADEGVQHEQMREFLYRDRNDLSVYAKAMFGLALEKQGHQEQLAMILRNIKQYLVEDAENETAYLKLPENNYWWHWYGSDIEANAYYLKLLSRTEPKGTVAPRLVKYLLNNRKHATYWRSTRDTAVCVEAFADYLRGSGEMKPDMVVEVYVDGQKRKEVSITADNMFTYDNKFLLAGDELTSGSHDVEIRRTGKGPVYFNAYLTNFTLEDPIARAGLEVKVERKVYKLVPVDKTIKAEGSRGQAVDQKVEKFERVPLNNLDSLTSGDLVEVELEIESKNDYEYLLFEDMKAAGFEPVEVRSGYTNDGLNAYVEYRDNRVSFFVRRLARGKHSVSYRLRAEIPGKFSALPTKAFAMYAPELKANSDEIKLQIVD